MQDIPTRKAAANPVSSPGRPSGRETAGKGAAHDTESDDSDLDRGKVNSDKQSTSSPQLSAATQPKRRMGMLGGSKSKKAVKDDSGNVTDSAVKTEAEGVEPQSAVLSATSRSKLGLIGGRKTRKATSQDKRSVTPVTSEILDAKQAARDDDSTPLSSGLQLSERGREPDTKTEVEQINDAQPRQTSQERANKRRDELKRQLAASTAGGGAAKKKRKF